MQHIVNQNRQYDAVRNVDKWSAFFKMPAKTYQYSGIFERE